jgi:hypothetical protein
MKSIIRGQGHCYYLFFSSFFFISQDTIEQIEMTLQQDTHL